MKPNVVLTKEEARLVLWSLNLAARHSVMNESRILLSGTVAYKMLGVLGAVAVGRRRESRRTTRF